MLLLITRSTPAILNFNDQDRQYPVVTMECASHACVCWRKHGLRTPYGTDLIDILFQQTKKIPMEVSDQRRSITLRFLAEPTEINFGGKVHGGTVMKWIDQAGYACAVGWSSQYCVTVYVGGIRFYHPIHIGDLVEVQATLIYTGTTSMHIAVDVRAGDPKLTDRQKTTHCIIIFVAVDRDGTPSPIPAWQPQTESDRKLEAYAQQLMALRKGIEEEMSHYRADEPLP